MWRLSNIPPKNLLVIAEIKGEIKEYVEISENRNMTYQNLWDASKVVIEGKFIAIRICLKKHEKSQTI